LNCPDVATDCLATFTEGAPTVRESVTVTLKLSELASVLVNVNVGVNVAILLLFYNFLINF
jgi:hypothetical protein